MLWQRENLPMRILWEAFEKEYEGESMGENINLMYNHKQRKNIFKSEHS